MQTLQEIRDLLAGHGLAPRHALGQNFLIDHNLIRKLADESGVRPGDTVLEVGPGTGTLTEELLARGARVLACELDRGLANLLRERLGHNAAFTLIEGDCLEDKRTLNRDLAAALGSGPWTLVANLPYGAATPLITTLLVSHPACRGLYATIQKEVAARLAAGPGSKDYGALSIIAQACARVRPIATLPPECFWPRPEVRSAMVAIERRPVPRCDDPAALAAFCQTLFEKRRKQLGAVLGRGAPFPTGVAATDRAEDLDVDTIIALFRALGRGGVSAPA